MQGGRSQRALDNANHDHEVILSALRSRDALLTVSAATVHMTALEQWLAHTRGGPPRRTPGTGSVTGPSTSV